MANRIITFSQDPIQKRLQDNPLEVFIDVDMIADPNVLYTYDYIQKELSTYCKVLATEGESDVSAIANDISANDVTKVSGPIALFNELTAAQYDRHQIPHFNNYKISRLANVNAIRNSLKNIFSWIPGQRVLLPEFGSNLRKLLYEGITEYNVEQIITEIKRVVTQWEPRVQIQQIYDASTVDDHENNTVHLKITYVIPGLSDKQFEYEYVQQVNSN